jgi:CarboxypepD_reg-like domain/TonB-dependent Receptor Plug Domain
MLTFFTRCILRFSLIVLVFFTGLTAAQAQKGKVRGNVFDKANGQPIAYANVFFQGTNIATTTDMDGFFSLDADAGRYDLATSYVGYDSVTVTVQVVSDKIVYQRITLNENQKNLQQVEVSGVREARRAEVLISAVTITPQQIKSLPSTGGEPDIAQYLTVLPGIVSTGDQGGQLYIRGGAPVQNRILLDGMTIYNPFHSIGFYSVFETETLRSVDVLTGGFNAEYGGRISAIVDLKTKEGNKKQLSGIVSASPFQAKVLLEGPIAKLSEEGGGSVSFLMTMKKSLLETTSTGIYKYAARDSNGLPYRFQDFYGKISAVAANGSKVNLFGFNFTDGVNFKGVTDMNWTSSGGGANFTLIPSTTNSIVGGVVSYSKYAISLLEGGKPDARVNDISSFDATVDFTYFTNQSELKYGFNISGFSTNFNFKSPLGFTYDDEQNTTELAGFVKYRLKFKKLVIEFPRPALFCFG